MLANLFTDDVLILRQSQAVEEDDFATPDTTPDEEVETVGALQQEQRGEAEGQGEFSETRWVLFLPATTEIDTTDRVVVDGRVYEVTGDPWPVKDHPRGTTSHLEVTLERTGDAYGSGS